MGRIRIGGLLASGALVAGCTSLSTAPSDMNASHAVVGIPYALPALQYDLAITRTLIKCEMRGDTVVAEFETKVEPAPKLIAGEWFVADYRKLDSVLKISSLAIETYDNQTIKSVNASAEDRTPEIALGIVKAGITIAKLAAGIPPVSPVMSGNEVSPIPVQPTPDLFSCPDTKLAAVEKLRAARKTLVIEVGKKTKELDPLRVEALIGTLSDADKDRISKLRNEILALTDKIEAADKLIDEQGKGLSLVETISWTPTQAVPAHTISFGKATSGESPVEQARVETHVAWLNALFADPAKRAAADEVFAQWIASLPANAQQAAKDKVKQYYSAKTASLVQGGADQLALVAVAEPVADPALSAAAVKAACASAGLEPNACASGLPARPGGDPRRRAAARGFLFRTPIEARMRVCKGIDSAPCLQRNGKAGIVASHSGLLPQMGRLGLLPFTNGVGQNNALVATFRPDGSPSKVQYDDKKAAAEGIINAANSGLDAVLAYDKERRAEIVAAREAAATEAEAEAAALAGAPAAELQRQIDLAKQQKELLELQAALDAESVASRREAEDLAAKIARLESLKKIKELEAQLGGSGD